ncbi:MAG: hypothetical protein ACFFAX_10395 [Promethearchaeota archaeon]
MNDLRKLAVSILTDGRANPAYLSYDNGIPILTDIQSKGKQPTTDVEHILIQEEIIVDHRGIREKRKLLTPAEVVIAPISRKQMQYILDGSRPEPLYPPSSQGWFSRVVDGGRRAIFLLHDLAGNDGFWLSIVDTRNNEYLEAHTILPFEKGVLDVSDETAEHESMFVKLSESTRAEVESWMNSILDGPPPEWNELAQITSDVYVPGLTIGENMRDTLELLVPRIYRPEIRNQVLAFLGAIVKGHHPDEDPVTYFEKFHSKQVLRNLLMGHLYCDVNDEIPPSYVRIMQEGALQRLGSPDRAVSETWSDPWHQTYYKVMDGFPKLFDTAVKYSAKLNAAKRITLGLPIPESQAAKSKKKWIERFKLMAVGIMLRAQLRPNSVGLKRIAYTGHAHQWPSVHMKWSAKIEGAGHREPSVQIMEMPNESLEATLHARPNLMIVDWTGAAVNEHLYDETSRTWRVSVSRIMGGLSGRRSIRRLGNEFGEWRGSEIHKPTQTWAKALDATANLSYLADLGQDKYIEYMGLSRSQLLSSLKEMNEKGVISILYVPNVLDLMMIAVIAQGKAGNICSLARAFMKHSPTATVHLAQKGKWLLVLSRQPTSTAHRLIATLPEESAKVGIALRCNRLTSFRSYTRGFYRRLLRDDGTWKDDVTQMLSQIRLPYHEQVSGKD